MENLEVDSVGLLICYWTDRRFWVSVNNQPERSKVTIQYVVAKDFKEILYRLVAKAEVSTFVDTVKENDGK